MRFWPCALFALLSLVAAGEARAQPSARSCIEAYSNAQVLRSKKQLVAARASLDTCLAVSCPDPVRADCASLLDTVKREIPTVVFSARDEQGADLVDTKVSVDGALVSDKLDGSAVALDPGVRVVRFQLPDGSTVERKVLLREGEHLREVAVVMKPKPAAPAPKPTAPVTPPARPRQTASTGPGPLPWVFAGVGVAGLGVFTAFALAGHSKENELDRCAPECDRASHQGAYDAMKRDYLIGDVALGVGVVSLGIGTWLLLRTGSSRGPSVGLQLAPRSVSVSGRF
jgi:hypothetical protein